MDRLDIFRNALGEVQVLREMYPDFETLGSIEKQLEYLISVASGINTDKSKIKEIVMGVQAAREVEPLSQNAADLIYKADSEARRML